MYQPNTNKPNTQEVVLPSEIDQNPTALPTIISRLPLDWPVERFTQALTRREDNRKALLRWIESNLVVGIDYGQIHVVGKDKCRLAQAGKAHECVDPRHWSKPSLWKPGAEKICGMLGLIPRFPNLNEYEHAVLRGEDIKVIILKCELHTGNGFVAAEGTGARRIAQDNGDINKSLKMAEKSAHIDATLRVAGLSEIFTQDLEDMANGAKQDIQPDTDRQPPPSKPPQTESIGNPAAQPPPKETEGNDAKSSNNDYSGNGGNGNNRITGKQYKFIMDLMKNSGITKRDLNAHCVETYGSVLDHISRNDASSLIDWLRNR